jgi:hypothetical protein
LPGSQTRLATRPPRAACRAIRQAPGGIIAGQAGYDLRRLVTLVHTRLLQPGLAQLTDPDPPMPTVLRTVARNYQRARAAGTLGNGTEKGANDGHIR